MQIDKSQAEALLDVLKSRPVFRRHPQFAEAFYECNFKRFIANPDMQGMDMMDMAKRMGGALALAQHEPPRDIVKIIVKVLDQGQTFLLMCGEENDRVAISKMVDKVYEARNGKGKPAVSTSIDIGPIDTAHRSLTTAASIH